jgi:uncharacterized protein YsxB (DUF464 family)
MCLIDPTSANLPFWSIGVLVAAVGALFSILLKQMLDAVKERKEIQLRLEEQSIAQQLKIENLNKEHDEKIEILFESSLEDQKKMAILLNDNIQLIQSLTRKK